MTLPDVSEPLIKRICEAVGDGVAVADETGVVLFADRRMELAAGFGEDGLAGRTVKEVVAGDSEVPTAERAESIVGGKGGPEPFYLENGAGSESQPVDVETFGTTDQYHLLSLDGSANESQAGEHQRADRGETRDGAPEEGYIVADGETGRVLAVSPGHASLFASEGTNGEGLTLSELRVGGKADFGELREGLAGADEAWRYVPVETGTGRGPTRDGAVLMSMIRLNSESYCLVGIRDIKLTARKQAGGGAGENSDPFRTLIEQTTDAVLLINPTTRTVKECNTAACDLFEYSREELLASPLAELYPDEPDRMREFIQEVVSTGAGQTERCRHQKRNGKTFVSEVSARVLGGEEQVVLAVIRDQQSDDPGPGEVVEQTDQLAVMFEHATDPFATARRTGTGEWALKSVNEAFEERFGAEPGRELDALSELLQVETFCDGTGHETLADCFDGTEVRTATVELPTVDGAEEFLVKLVPGKSLDQAYIVFTGTTDGVRYTHHLKDLNRATIELMQTHDTQEIAERALSAVSRTLGFELSAVRLYEPDTNEFAFAHLSEKAQSLLESERAYQFDRTHAGQAYRDGEPVHNRESTRMDSVEYDIEAHLHLPLDNHGVLTVATENEEAFDPSVVEFAKLLATSITTAYERAGREADLRASQEELLRQRNDLQRLNDVHELLQMVIRRLTHVNTKEELEKVVCRLLVDSEFYDCAWIAEINATDDSIVPRASAGINTELLEAFARMDLAALEGGVIKKTAETGEVSVINQASMDIGEFTDVEQSEQVKQLVSTASVPIVDRERQYGVLVLKSEETGIFEEATQRGLRILGEIIGFAISALRSQSLLASESLIELKFEVTDEDSVLVTLSEMLGCRPKMEGIVPVEDGNLICYVSVQHDDCEEIIDMVGSLDGVTSARVLEETNGDCRVEFVKTGPRPESLHEFGARTKNAVAKDGVVQITAEVPLEADIRDLVETYQSVYPSATLTSKQQIDAQAQTGSGWESLPTDRLTDKQARALRAAFRAGYYEWPRQSTAEEVAATLGVSSSTFHQHLRRAHQRIVGAMFEQDGEPPGEQVRSGP